MATIKLGGAEIHTCGNLPSVGSIAPDFILTKSDLTDVSLKDFSGKNRILNVFPSLDTSVCALSVRKFNAEASSLRNTVVLCISTDLPFAHKRFCAAEGISAVITLSEMRRRSFGEDYGLRIIDGPLAGAFSRCVIILDAAGKVLYTEQVPEIKQEPDYAAALEIIRKLD